MIQLFETTIPYKMTWLDILYHRILIGNLHSRFPKQVEAFADFEFEYIFKPYFKAKIFLKDLVG